MHVVLSWARSHAAGHYTAGRLPRRGSRTRLTCKRNRSAAILNRERCLRLARRFLWPTEVAQRRAEHKMRLYVVGVQPARFAQGQRLLRVAVPPFRVRTAPLDSSGLPPWQRGSSSGGWSRQAVGHGIIGITAQLCPKRPSQHQAEVSTGYNAVASMPRRRARRCPTSPACRSPIPASGWCKTSSYPCRRCCPTS
jgi:hypothetical protein